MCLYLTHTIDGAPGQDDHDGVKKNQTPIGGHMDACSGFYPNPACRG
jgi:hypothetical protein